MIYVRADGNTNIGMGHIMRCLSISDAISDIADASKKPVFILAKNAAGEVAGGAAQVSGPTYDQATILVGMGSDGIVKGVQFLKNTDSPGFGLKANDSTFKLPNGKTFYGQFEGKDAKAGFELGKNFDAISGATITSNGVAGLLNAGTEVLLKYAGGHNE